MNTPSNVVIGLDSSEFVLYTPESSDVCLFDLSSVECFDVFRYTTRLLLSNNFVNVEGFSFVIYGRPPQRHMTFSDLTGRCVLYIINDMVCTIAFQ